ncbi:MAG: glutamate racemase [Bacteroidia bacterium]|nr:glutamate racemase [Bacteroidia bacterium]
MSFDNSHIRPIGVFDSGIGGLTVVKALQERLPNEHFLYFGDTAHLPYGDKSPELIRQYCSVITDFLLLNQVKSVVVACNTASAVAFEQIKNRCPSEIPVIEVITPAVDMAVKYSNSRRIGVIGTKTTILSHLYLRKILERVPEALVVEKATPLLVPMIEEGWNNNKISREIIEAYMSDTGFMHVDTLILGCTHYPLVKQAIENYFKTNDRKVTVIDSSLAIAETLAGLLEQNNLNNSHKHPDIQDKFFVSDITESFRDSAALFFGDDVQLKKINLDFS